MASIGSARVRIVARIRGSTNKDTESLPVLKQSISVSRPDSNGSGRVKISFSSDQITSGKQNYELDECYEEEVGNEELFSKEIKPLISGLFQGQNVTVFAYGSRGSGKTYTIQGSDEEYGLVTFTLASILPQAEKEGKVVNVSVFEVCQDRIIDLLDSKRSEVIVVEDVLGKIKLKGLSKVKLNTTEEFQKLYRDAVNTRMQKAAEPPHRSHIGCILHIVSPQTENSKAKLVGKINFIDLATYEDSRRVSSDGLNLTDTSRIKKSLNVVHNVLYALNAKERVPYRESKLTRMLQDSLGGSSSTLMVTCINPSFCQETVQTINISSRSCTVGFPTFLDPIKSDKSATTRMFSPQVMKSASKLSIRTNLMATPQISKSTSKPLTRTLMSPKVLNATSASTSTKKHSRSHLGKASSGVTIQKTKRKLVADVNQSNSPKQENACSVPASSVEVNQGKSPKQEKATDEHAYSETDFPEVLSEKETSNAPLDVNSSQFILEEDVIQAENNITATPCAYKTPTTGSYLVEGKENKLNDGSSPPLSSRIRNLSNNLKSLCFSTEAKLKMTQEENSRFSNQVIYENFEPKTPTSQMSARASEKYNKTNNASPWSTMKDSLVQESLKILNSATKEELKGLKGIGEKRATYILEFRDESPEPFKKLDDLKDIGLSEKQIKELVKNVAGNLL